MALDGVSSRHCLGVGPNSLALGRGLLQRRAALLTVLDSHLGGQQQFPILAEGNHAFAVVVFRVQHVSDTPQHQLEGQLRVGLRVEQVAAAEADGTRGSICARCEVRLAIRVNPRLALRKPGGELPCLLRVRVLLLSHCSGCAQTARGIASTRPGCRP